jgi:hypothetical protein
LNFYYIDINMAIEEKKENTVSQLLTEVVEVRKHFETKWQKTGEKYNIFNVAGIANKEVIMCRVLADLLNPQGKHCQGSRYLSLFWKTISSKLPEQLKLNVDETKVTAEEGTDENRRIDITLEDRNIFIPIEVKIGAGDQPKQVADYHKFAREKNKVKKNNVNVPVLYLTVDGHEPSKISKDDVDEADYVMLSFKNHILTWLEACVRENENIQEITIPVRENMRQFIAAIKSQCGKSEDAEMEEEIFKKITKDEDTVRAALDISCNMDFKEKALEAFKGPVLKLVKEEFQVAVFNPAEGLNMIQVEVMGGNYILDVNFDWKTFSIECGIEKKEERNSQIEARLTQVMTDYTNHINENRDGIFDLYGTNRYPGFETVDEDLYFYKLYKLYTEQPQEAADKIINITRELENVKV